MHYPLLYSNNFELHHLITFALFGGEDTINNAKPVMLMCARAISLTEEVPPKLGQTLASGLT